MPHFKMTIAYNGAPFSGWQVQPNGISIQALIQEAFLKILKIPLTVIGSGRTDAGVHARAQIAHFTLETPVDLNKLHYSLNGMLPQEIRIKDIEEVDPSFHARFSAKRKIYHYTLSTGKVHDPLTRAFCYHVSHPLNLEAIEEAIKHLIGCHNFRAFANKSSQGSALHDPHKTLYAIRMIKDDSQIRFEFEGSGFLYKMVRNIMGTLLDCGKGKITPLDVKSILDSQDRKIASDAAPPHGLCLYQVIYD